MRKSKWEGKKVLTIGDSITADGRWQKEFEALTGCEISKHAKGGIGVIDMVDGYGAYAMHLENYDAALWPRSELEALSVADVADKDLIIFFGGYNIREIEYGEKGDMWPENRTLRGQMAYVVEKIFALLETAGNLTCRVMLVAPHCVGKYDWIDADGYGDWPAGSGRSLETMAELIKTIAGEYNIPCYDAFHNSGINRFTWKVFAHSPVVMSPDYDPEKEYTAPYPQNADQAHLNDAGNVRLGACIAAFAETV